MNKEELAKRDYRKAKMNYLRSKNKTNVTQSELKNSEILLKLRKEILDIVQREVWKK